MNLPPYVVLLSLWLFPLLASAQPRSLSGQVLDDSTQQPIPYATLQYPGMPSPQVADEAGSFTLRLPNHGDSLDLQVRALGYAPLQLRFSLRNVPPYLTLRLQPVPYQLDPVWILSPEEILAKALVQTQLYDTAAYVLDVYYHGTEKDMITGLTYFDLEAVGRCDFRSGYQSSYHHATQPYLAHYRNRLPHGTQAADSLYWGLMDEGLIVGQNVLYFPYQLDDKKWSKKVDLELVSYATYRGQPVFILTYRVKRFPRQGSHLWHLGGSKREKPTYHEGNIYVQASDFAIVRREFRVGFTDEPSDLPLTQSSLLEQARKRGGPTGRNLYYQRHIVRTYTKQGAHYYLAREEVDYQFIYPNLMTHHRGKAVVLRDASQEKDRMLLTEGHYELTVNDVLRGTFSPQVESIQNDSAYHGVWAYQFMAYDSVFWAHFDGQAK